MLSATRPRGWNGHPTVGPDTYGTHVIWRVTFVLLGKLLFCHCATYANHVMSKLKLSHQERFAQDADLPAEGFSINLHGGSGTSPDGALGEAQNNNPKKQLRRTKTDTRCDR